MFKSNLFSCLRNLSLAVKFSWMVLLIDQATKLLVTSILPMNIAVSISPKLHIFPTLNVVSNPIFTSILKLSNHDLVYVYILLNLILIFLWKKSVELGCKNPVFFMALGSIIAGGLSNGIDRMHLKGSVDWILYRMTEDCYLGFNLADIAIECGLITLLVSVVIQIAEITKLKKIQLTSH